MTTKLYKSKGDIKLADVERMIADWRICAAQQHLVTQATGNAKARANAERYDRLARQGRDVLDRGMATFESRAKSINLDHRRERNPA